MDEYPIIAAGEQECPDCGHELPRSGTTPVCPGCQRTFERVDVSEQQPSADAKVCACGYQLRGLELHRCPECGSEVEFDVADYVVEHDQPQGRPEPDLPRLFPGARAGMGAIATLGLLLIVLAIILIDTEFGESIPTALFLSGAGLAGLSGIAWLLLR